MSHITEISYPVALFQVNIDSCSNGLNGFGKLIKCNHLAQEYFQWVSLDDWTAPLDTVSKHALAMVRQSFITGRVSIQVNIKNTSFGLITNNAQNIVHCVLVKLQDISHFGGTRMLLNTSSPTTQSTTPSLLRSGISLHLFVQAQTLIQKVMHASARALSNISMLTESDVDKISTLKFADLRRETQLIHVEEILSTFDPKVAFFISPSAQNAISLDPFSCENAIRSALLYFHHPDRHVSGSVNIVEEGGDRELQITVESSDESTTADQTFVNEISATFEASINADKNLVLCRAFCEAMGGRLILQPRGWTTGSLLTIVSNVQQPTVLPKVKQQLEHHKPSSVLVVEDNKLNAQVLEKMIRSISQHVEIRHAVDGREAVERASKERFDLIFMDIDIPIWNGFEAATAIRRFEQENMFAPAYIVGVSGTVNADQERRMKVAGINDFISKPYKTTKIRDVILSVDRYAVSTLDSAPSTAS